MKIISADIGLLDGKAHHGLEAPNSNAYPIARVLEYTNPRSDSIPPLGSGCDGGASCNILFYSKRL